MAKTVLPAPQVLPAARASSPGRLLQAALLVFLGVVGLVLWLGAVGTYVDRLQGDDETSRAQDYLVFYAAGRLVIEGDGGALYDGDAVARAERDALGLADEEVSGLYFLNPPFVAAAFAPTSALSYPVASLVVGVIGMLLIAAGAFALLRFLRVREPRAALLLLAAFLASPATGALVGQGQLSMLLVFGLLGFVASLAAGRERAAGLSLALLLAKPQTAVVPLIYLSWQRRWRALGAFLAAGAALAAVSLFVAGPEAFVDYPRFLIESGRAGGGGLHSEATYGWTGFFGRLTSYGGAAHVALVALATAATVGVAAVACASRLDLARPSSLYGASALLLAAVLVNPHVHLHDLTVVAVALALSARACQLGSGSAGPWPLLAGLTWLAVAVGWHLQVVAEVNVVAPALFALLLVNARQARRTDAEYVEQPAARAA